MLVTTLFLLHLPFLLRAPFPTVTAKILQVRLRTTTPLSTTPAPTIPPSCALVTVSQTAGSGGEAKVMFRDPMQVKFTPCGTTNEVWQTIYWNRSISFRIPEGGSVEIAAFKTSARVPVVIHRHWVSGSDAAEISCSGTLVTRHTYTIVTGWNCTGRNIVPPPSPTAPGIRTDCVRQRIENGKLVYNLRAFYTPCGTNEEAHVDIPGFTAEYLYASKGTTIKLRVKPAASSIYYVTTTYLRAEESNKNFMCLTQRRHNPGPCFVPCPDFAVIDCTPN